ncbi:11445_t:CDS:1, partial [Paraglomus brasilianum]
FDVVGSKNYNLMYSIRTPNAMLPEMSRGKKAASGQNDGVGG